MVYKSKPGPFRFQAGRFESGAGQGGEVEVFSPRAYGRYQFSVGRRFSRRRVVGPPFRLYLHRSITSFGSSRRQKKSRRVLRLFSCCQLY